MEEESETERLHAVVDRLLARTAKDRQVGLLSGGLLSGGTSPFDTSRPNFHESKAAFDAEFTAVSAVVASAFSMAMAVMGRHIADEAARMEMTERLRQVVDQLSRGRRSRTKLESASDLAFLNIVDTGFYHNSISVLGEMHSVYGQRLIELEDQRIEFWTVKNRPPNYYARTIALRLARLYAGHYRKKPTFGTARDGGHPSTDFGRALEEVFHILGVKAAVKGAATWAIGQLTEEDTAPVASALPAYGYNALAFKLPTRSRASQNIADALMKRDGT